MEAKTRLVTEVLRDGVKGEPSLVVPAYQRSFTWDADRCVDMLNRMWATAQSGKAAEDKLSFFMGTVVLHRAGTKRERAVVDGQQRLTCFTMIEAALLRFAKIQVSAGEDAYKEMQNELGIKMTTCKMAEGAVPSPRIRPKTDDERAALAVICKAEVAPVPENGSQLATVFNRLCDHLNVLATTTDGVTPLRGINNLVELLDGNARVVEVRPGNVRGEMRGEMGCRALRHHAGHHAV